jgi:hypothetical protein
MGGLALLAGYGLSLVFRHFCSNSHDLNDIKYMPCSRGGLINYLSSHLSRLSFIAMKFQNRFDSTSGSL